MESWGKRSIRFIWQAEYVAYDIRDGNVLTFDIRKHIFEHNWTVVICCDNKNVSWSILLIGPPKYFWWEFDYAYAFLNCNWFSAFSTKWVPGKMFLFSYPDWIDTSMGESRWRISLSLRKGLPKLIAVVSGVRYQKATMKTELVLKIHPGDHVGAILVFIIFLLPWRHLLINILVRTFLINKEITAFILKKKSATNSMRILFCSFRK